YPATQVQVFTGDTAQDSQLADHDLLLIGARSRLPLLQRWQEALPVGGRRQANAALLGFESPLSPRRSVVAVTAATPQALPLVLDMLDNDKVVFTLHGGAVLLPAQGGPVESVAARRTYTTGELPFWTAIWYPLSSQPVLLALMAVLAVLIFAFALWRTLKATAERRLGGH
ncbi:cellulose biosynthesis cyclic di-GMP-binding regulatory protein BcsB, partial [Leptospira sp. SA-E8]|uniref:cellulose biosynthesis cyclic di-GMP-binding regulatory protein BcsB n=1 Tax=Leptospira sp. SA-E8 TaxID=3422259 RepID=UPI003EBADDEC